MTESISGEIGQTRRGCTELEPSDPQVAGKCYDSDGSEIPLDPTEAERLQLSDFLETTAADEMTTQATIELLIQLLNTTTLKPGTSSTVKLNTQTANQQIVRPQGIGVSIPEIKVHEIATH